MVSHNGEYYLRPATMHSDRSVVVQAALRDLRNHRKHFDAIVVSGYSSVVVSAIVANELGVDILIARKEAEPCNSSMTIDGAYGGRYVFIDDFIVSGKTLERVSKAVESADGTLYGVWLYKEVLCTTTVSRIRKYGSTKTLHSHTDPLVPY